MIKIANWVEFVLRRVFLTLVYYCVDGAAFFISLRAYRKKACSEMAVFVTLIYWRPCRGRGHQRPILLLSSLLCSINNQCYQLFSEKRHNLLGENLRTCAAPAWQNYHPKSVGNTVKTVLEVPRPISLYLGIAFLVLRITTVVCIYDWFLKRLPLRSITTRGCWRLLLLLATQSAKNQEFHYHKDFTWNHLLHILENSSNSISLLKSQWG